MINYTYVAKPYKKPKVIRRGDIVEIRTIIGVYSSNLMVGMRGSIYRDPSSRYTDIPHDACVVDVPGLGTQVIFAKHIKLMKRYSRTLRSGLEYWLKYGEDPVGRLNYSCLTGDKAIYVSDSVGIIAALERKSIKLNKSSNRYKPLLPIFREFSLDQHIPLYSMNTPLINPKLKGPEVSKGQVFWKLKEKRSHWQRDEVERHNMGLQSPSISELTQRITTYTNNTLTDIRSFL